MLFDAFTHFFVNKPQPQPFPGGRRNVLDRHAGIAAAMAFGLLGFCFCSMRHGPDAPALAAVGWPAGLALVGVLRQRLGMERQADGAPVAAARSEAGTMQACAPQSSMASAAAAGDAPSAPTAPHPGRRLAGLRLLVVDDVLINREIASRLLTVEGAQCEGAEDGLQALALLRAAVAAGTGFDGVFMDVQMPLMDGLQATRRMRADPALAAVPVIALTAGTLPQQRLAAMEAGMDDFIAKPIRADLMVESLLRHLPGRGWTETQAPQAPQALQAASRPAPQPELPVVPGVDTEQAARRLQGNRMLFLSMLRSLRDDFGDVPRRTREDLARGDFTAAAARLHRLRGLAGNVSAETVAAFAGQLEDALRDGANRRGIEPALAGLGMALNELLAALPPEVDHPYGMAAPAPAVVDPALVRDLLGALATGDMDALSQYHALRPALAARHGHAALDELDRAVDLLRFQQAIAVLRGWYPGA